MVPNEAWAQRQERTEEARRGYERERLILWTLDSVAELLADAGVSKADVARKLGTSRAHVTQVFSGSRNVTLNTISDLAWACGKRAVVRFEPLRSGEYISQPMVLRSTQARIVSMESRQMPGPMYAAAGGK
jgi:3-oxoacyl-(acyl-carrier-protein) synthase